MNLFSAQIVSLLLVLILVEKASARKLGWKPSWDDDWGSSSSKSSKSSSKSSKSSSGGWGGWDNDDWKGWNGRRHGGRHKKKNHGWRKGEYVRGICFVSFVDNYTNIVLCICVLTKIVGYYRWGGRDLTVGMDDAFDEVSEIEEEATNEALGN
jgi:hypothetical protein